MPKVSVVIPVFNRPVAVRRAIDSVLAQTFQNFEIIVIDDGSTDETAPSLAALTDPRIAVIRHDRRLGGSVARNTGIRAGSAPYIAFLDSDDEWLPAKLERQLEVFERSRDDLALVYTGVERVYLEGGSVIHIPRREANLARTLLTENVVGEASVGMVRRSAIDAVGAFDEVLPAAQDMDLWLRLCERFSADFVPEVLVRAACGDPDRITASIPSTTRGRELFRNKHRDKLRHHGVLHLHLLESGWWFLRGARDFRSARRCCLESLRAQPLALRTYALLVATCMPMSWLDRLAGYKHRVTAGLSAVSRPTADAKRSAPGQQPAPRQAPQ